MGDVTVTSDDGEPEPTSGPPTNRASAKARIVEISELLNELDNAPHTAMTPFYYQHGFNELDLAVRDLLHIINTGLGSPAAGWDEGSPQDPGPSGQRDPVV